VASAAAWRRLAAKIRRLGGGAWRLKRRRRRRRLPPATHRFAALTAFSSLGDVGGERQWRRR